MVAGLAPKRSAHSGRIGRTIPKPIRASSTQPPRAPNPAGNRVRLVAMAVLLENARACSTRDVNAANLRLNPGIAVYPICRQTVGIIITTVAYPAHFSYEIGNPGQEVP